MWRESKEKVCGKGQNLQYLEGEKDCPEATVVLPTPEKGMSKV